MVMSEEILIKQNQGNNKQSINQIESRLEDEPLNDELLVLRGKAFYKAGNWQEAMQCFLDALAVNPESPAKTMLEMTNNILGFYNKDVYGQ